MTADTITIDDMAKLESLLDAAVQKIFWARIGAEQGDITTERAAEIVNEVRAAIELSTR